MFTNSVVLECYLLRSKTHSDLLIDIVTNQIKEKLNNGHSLYMDHFYNSIHLALKLLLKQIYCTNTLRMNRKNHPK